MSQVPRIDDVVAEATDGRARHPFDTKSAAEALGVHPNKFGDWANRTEDKLVLLARRQPAQVAAFCLRILAQSYASPDAAKKQSPGRPSVK